MFLSGNRILINKYLCLDDNFKQNTKYKVLNLDWENPNNEIFINNYYGWMTIILSRNNNIIFNKYLCLDDHNLE